MTIAQSGEFVGSVRVPERDIDVDGVAAKAAGIAEVCSDPAYRGQGIASVALPDAMAYCDNASGCAFSMLHAAPAVSGLYAKYGYVGLTVPYSRIAMPTATAAGDSASKSSRNNSFSALPSRAIVRPADLTNEEEVQTLDSLHRSTNQWLGVTGFTHRSLPYWQRWIPVVAGAGYHVLELPSSGAEDGATSSIVAYVCVLNKGGLRVFDYGARLGVPVEVSASFILRVASNTVAAEVAEGKTAADAPEVASLLIPTRLAEAVLPPGATPSSSCSAAADESVADRGWMIRPLGGGPEGREGGQREFDALMKASAEGRFLVWVADSF